MATPIVLKKPLKVYKVGKSTSLGSFISLYRNCIYTKYNIMPTIKINPRFIRYIPYTKYWNELWNYDCFCIHKGYHSYLTEEEAKRRMYFGNIGIFEIPVGATIYVNFEYREVVSTDIRYLGLLEQ